MKSHVSGRVVPPPQQQSNPSGCRPQNIFYNHLGIHHHNQHQIQHHPHQHHQHQQHHQQNLAYHPHHQHHHQQPQHQNYAMLQCFSQHATNDWAGIPLISTAASSNRRQRKPPASMHRSSAPTPAPPPPSQQQQQQISCNSLHMYNSNRDPHTNEYDLNPMARLAMHAQGAPLLLTGSYNRNRLNAGGCANRQMRSLNPNQNEDYPCNFKAFGPLSLHQSKAKENNNCNSIGGGTNTQNEAAAAACLPRIIKPRKRRKKDRKPLPPTGNFVKVNIEPEMMKRGPMPPTNFMEKQMSSSLHHQHHPQMLGFEFETQCNLKLKKDETTPIDMQDPTGGTVCFCRQCDPLSRIWAFPLRRSHSDNSSDTTEFEKTNKNVGVIGSNRSSQLNLIKSTHTGSLSDSSDSGYGDILSGINIGDDFFSNTNNYLQLQKLPTDLLLSPTAESLLTESINEISRKLMETCDIKGANGGSSPSSLSSSSSASSSSSDSCSVFSDSGISSATSSHHNGGDELIFNFENLSINPTDQHHSNVLFPNNNDTFFDCFSADINNNIMTATGNGGGGSPRIDPQFFNCLDLLWDTSNSGSQQNTSTSPTSSSSTSAAPSSFYRPTVASM